MIPLALCFPMKGLLPWKICFHSVPHCLCEPHHLCLAPLRLKGCRHHSNACLITRNECPVLPVLADCQWSADILACSPV